MRAIRFGIAAAALAFAGAASAQSGHFVQTQTCRDTGTTVTCSGKVAGLGGTTFAIEVQATGTAIVECRNPGGQVAPGQNTTIDAVGGTGSRPTPRNGQFRYTVSTVDPTVPNTPTCPNARWEAEVVDVVFTGDATITLYENGTPTDQVTVPIN